jgi:hypothetical protein
MKVGRAIVAGQSVTYVNNKQGASRANHIRNLIDWKLLSTLIRISILMMSID